MITEILLTDIQHFLVKEVKNSAEFEALSQSLLNESLNYYRGANLKGSKEKLPYFTSYKFNSQDEENKDSEWIVQFIIGIEGDEDYIVDGDGIKVYESTDHVEQLAVKALSVIKTGLRDGSFNGKCDLRIASVNIIITEVGEADDVQAIVTLRLEEYSTF